MTLFTKGDTSAYTSCCTTTTQRVSFAKSGAQFLCCGRTWVDVLLNTRSKVYVRADAASVPNPPTHTDVEPTGATAMPLGAALPWWEERAARGGRTRHRTRMFPFSACTSSANRRRTAASRSAHCRRLRAPCKA